MQKTKDDDNVNPSDFPLLVGLKMAISKSREVPAGGCEIVGNIIVGGVCAERAIKITTDNEGKCTVNCPFRERLGC